MKMDRIAAGPSCGLRPHHLHHRPGDDEVSVLDTLSDEELIEKMHRGLYHGMRNEVSYIARILLGRDWSAERVLNDGLVNGMRAVGNDLRIGITCMPEVLLACDAMEAGMEVLRPVLAVSDAVAKISYLSWAAWPRELTTAIASCASARDSEPALQGVADRAGRRRAP